MKDDEEDDYDPYAARVTPDAMNNVEAFISILKCAVGTGVLAMPRAFYNAGYINGFIGTIFIGIVILYALHILLKSMYIVCKRHHVPLLNYRDCMELALQEGPPAFRWFSIISGVMVECFLSLYHFGICCVYVVFIADAIKQFFDHFASEIDSRVYMVLLIFPLILIYSIRDLKHLVPFSAVANVFLFFGFGVVLYYVFEDLPDITTRTAFQDLAQYPLFFGTVLFAIESVGVIISIEANMATPKDYLGLFGILNCALFIVIILYAIMGLLGYWRYGDDIKGTISLNLPDEIMPRIIQILFAMAIWFSYALQGYVVIDVIWHDYISKRVADDKKLRMEFVMRCCVVLASVVCAICVPDVGMFLSLVGAFCLSFLGIIFPALIDVCVRYHHGYGKWYIYIVRDVLLICFGVLGGVLGTYTSVDEIYHYYVGAE